MLAAPAETGTRPTAATRLRTRPLHTATATTDGLCADHAARRPSGARLTRPTFARAVTERRSLFDPQEQR